MKSIWKEKGKINRLTHYSKTVFAGNGFSVSHEWRVVNFRIEPIPPIQHEKGCMRMLIINADDFGLDELNTLNILNAMQTNVITSTTAMTFSAYSEQAAELASDLDNGGIGLHLNFSYGFNAPSVDSNLKAHHDRIGGYLKKNKFTKFVYHPGLSNSMEYCYKAQLDEFHRLYDREPTHMDGHEYFHLCANFLFSKLLPKGAKLRPNINAYGKGIFRRAYKRVFNSLLSQKYNCVDRLYDLDANTQHCLDLLEKAAEESKAKSIELMVHIESDEEISFVHSDDYRSAIENANLGTYADLSPS